MSRTATSPRKRPRQARAQATVEAILEATAQLLSEVGYAKTTTNRIAERAGVSIGSLYEYFPNKDALLVALMEQVLDESFAAFAGTVERMRVAPLPAAARTIIDVLIESKRTRAPLIRALATSAPAGPRERFLRQWHRRACEAILLVLRDRDEVADCPDLDLTVFVLVNGVYGVLDAALVERVGLLEEERFVDELTALVLRHLEAA